MESPPVEYSDDQKIQWYKDVNTLLHTQLTAAKGKGSERTVSSSSRQSTSASIEVPHDTAHGGSTSRQPDVTSNVLLMEHLISSSH